MKKEKSLFDEFHSMMDTFSQKKKESIADLEEFKTKFISNINFHLDKLYSKKDGIKEVKDKKNEFGKSRLGVWAKIIRTNLWKTIIALLSMPFIYFMIIPGIIMHVCIEIYHQVCFRLYKIPLVRPKEYFVFDRRHLPQLNWLERFNCFYCSYYNCLMSYMQEIVGRTERYWCPIKHARRMENVHSHYEYFIEYTNAKNLRKDWKNLRKFKEVK